MSLRWTPAEAGRPKQSDLSHQVILSKAKGLIASVEIPRFTRDDALHRIAALPSVARNDGGESRHSLLYGVGEDGGCAKCYIVVTR
ncbi:MAG: hypothetical protein PVH82_00025 [Desulfobacteraceae bacterium]|jgi:hypothetical protein